MHKIKSIINFQQVTELGCKYIYKNALIYTESPKTPKEFIVLEQWKNKLAFWQFDIIPEGLNIKLKAIHAAPAKEDSKPMMRTTLYGNPEIQVINQKLYLKYDELYILVKTKSPIEISPQKIITDDRFVFLTKTKIEKVIANIHILKGDSSNNISDKYILVTHFMQIIGTTA